MTQDNDNEIHNGSYNKPVLLTIISVSIIIMIKIKIIIETIIVYLFTYQAGTPTWCGPNKASHTHTLFTLLPH